MTFTLGPENCWTVFTVPELQTPTFATTFAGDVAEIPVASSEPLAAEIDAFLRVVRDGGRPVVDGEDGLWAVAIANSLLLSAAERRPIDLTDLTSRLPVE